VSTGNEPALVARLRAGDERAFEEIVRQYNGLMVSVAMGYVSGRARAEEVVQETWLAVLRGLDRFEGRSSFKTWLFKILVNRARSHGVRDARSVPFSAFEDDEGGPAVAAERFLGEGHRWAGHWATPPSAFSELPEEQLLAQETIDLVAASIEELPPRQRAVIQLRDVEGWDAAEVCDALGLTDGNQRILLHRARSAVRQALEAYLTVAPTV
jgi:RNA polymerase sigma-70 factor, ECF subfamily